MSVWTSSVGRSGRRVAESGNRACCRLSFVSTGMTYNARRNTEPQALNRSVRMRTKLLDADLETALASLSGWRREGGAIVKTFQFGKFADGIGFVQRVAAAADEMDHHPDIDIR